MSVNRCETACLTIWGAVLCVHGHMLPDTLVLVSDPDAIDAGQWISKSEIVLMWRIKSMSVWQCRNAVNALVDADRIGKDHILSTFRKLFPYKPVLISRLTDSERVEYYKNLTQ